MGQEFRRFKRKIRVGAIVRAILLGLSLGVMTVAGLWLWAKLTIQAVDFVRWAIIGAIPAVLGMGIMLILLLPTNRRVARKLDRSLSLGEKVQTMVAFREDDSDMAVLQRMDTERILSETPRRRVKGVATWAFVALPLVAALCMVGTILVPAQEPEAPPPVVDNNFYLSPWQEQALLDLIEDVKKSDMEETPREGVVKQLESLLIQLRTIKKEASMKEAVVATVVNMHDVVTEYNRCDTIAVAMGQSASEDVRTLGAAIGSLKALLIGDRMNLLAEALQADDGAEVAALMATALPQALKEADVPTDHATYAALADFAEALASVTAETTDDEIGELMATADEAINAAVFLEATNEEVCEDAAYRLLTIFGLDAGVLPPDLFENSDGSVGEDAPDKDDDEDDKVHTGGLGTGEMIFGSDDMIYDPETGKYVSYGEVLKEYYARITEQLMDGKLSPELEELLSDYFAILFNGDPNQKD